MKNLILILVGLFLLLSQGCETDSITAPLESELNNNLLKNSLENSTGTLDDDDDDDDDDNWKWNGDDDNDEPVYRKSYTVDGSKGGFLYFAEEYVKKDSTIGRFNAWISIPKGAYEGVQTFDVIFYSANCSMELFPTPFTFDKPISLTLFFYNVDLDLNKNYLDFGYLGDRFENVEYLYKAINAAKGTVFVWGAKLKHFSRYGWTRTKENIKKYSYFSTE